MGEDESREDPPSPRAQLTKSDTSKSLASTHIHVDHNGRPVTHSNAHHGKAHPTHSSAHAPNPKLVCYFDADTQTDGDATVYKDWRDMPTPGGQNGNAAEPNVKESYTPKFVRAHLDWVRLTKAAWMDA